MQSSSNPSGFCFSNRGASFGGGGGGEGDPYRDGGGDRSHRNGGGDPYRNPGGSGGSGPPSGPPGGNPGGGGGDPGSSNHHIRLDDYGRVTSGNGGGGDPPHDPPGGGNGGGGGPPRDPPTSGSSWKLMKLLAVTVNEYFWNGDSSTSRSYMQKWTADLGSHSSNEPVPFL